MPYQVSTGSEKPRFAEPKAHSLSRGAFRWFIIASVGFRAYHRFFRIASGPRCRIIGKESRYLVIENTLPSAILPLGVKIWRVRRGL